MVKENKSPWLCYLFIEKATLDLLLYCSAQIYWERCIIRKISIIALATLSFVIFNGCNFAVPEKITVKADPTFELNIGTVTVGLNDYFSPKKMESFLKDDRNVKVYQYDKGDNKARFLAQYTFKKTIEGLQIDKYMKQLEEQDPIAFGYEDAKKNAIPKKLFTLPAIHVAPTLAPIEISDKFFNLSSDITFPEVLIPFYEPGSMPSGSQNLQPQNSIKMGEKFTKIRFKQGALNFTFQLDKAPSANNFKLEITKIALCSADGNEIAASTELLQVVFTESRTAAINLGGKTLPNEITVKLTTSISGGTLNSDVRNIKTALSFSEDTSIAQIEGLTVADVSVPLAETIVCLGSDAAMLKTAIIGAGSISFNAFLPNCCVSGLEYTASITAKQVVDDSYQGLNLYLPVGLGTTNLTGKSLNSKDIAISGSFALTVNNATIDFTQDTKIKPSASILISNFESITLDTSKTDSAGKPYIDPAVLTQTYTYSLEEVFKNVKKIEFTELGLDLNLANGLAKDLTLKVTSKALGLTGQPYIFAGNRTFLDFPTQIRAPTVGTPAVHTLDLTSDTVQDAAGKPQFDITLDIDIGIDANKLLTLENIDAPKDFYLYGKALTVMEWKTAYVVIPESLNDDFKKTIEKDLSKYKQGIYSEDVKLRELTPYIYASSPLLEKIQQKQEGKTFTPQSLVCARYTGDGVAKTLDIVGVAPDTYADVYFKPPVNIHNGLNDKKVYIGSLPEPSMNFTDEKKKKILDMLNAYPSDLKIDYEVKMAGGSDDSIPITKEDVDGVGNVDITITMLLDVPISVTINGSLTDSAGKGWGKIDLTKQNPHDDLFDRKSGDIDLNLIIDTVDDYTENTHSIISLRYHNNTGIPSKVWIYHGEKNTSGTYPFEKLVQLINDTGTISLDITYEEFKYIIKQNPFKPNIVVLLPVGDHDLQKDANIKISLIGTLKTRINRTFPLRNNQGGK